MFQIEGSIGTENKGWTCPKCSRVWAPSITECLPCSPSTNAGQLGMPQPNIGGVVYDPECGPGARP